MLFLNHLYSIFARFQAQCLNAKDVDCCEKSAINGFALAVYTLLLS